MRKLNVVELYAGTGRCSAPFAAWRRARVTLLADWSEHARRTYLHNHPRAPYSRVNLSGVDGGELEAIAGGKIHVLLGCPPCQGFSESGKRDDHDPRNQHVLHFARLAVATRPLAVAMENVPLAAKSQQFRDAIALLERGGYEWTAGILNAALYGSAQTRHRLVLLAVRKDVGAAPALPTATHAPMGAYYDYAQGRIRHMADASDDLLGTTGPARARADALPTRFFRVKTSGTIPTFREATAGLPKAGTPEGRSLAHEPWAHSAAMLARMAEVPEGGQLATERAYYGAAYARLHRRGLARTLTTYFANPGSGRFWHPTENRAITVREAARIQGFDDKFAFPGGATLANAVLLGNALDAGLGHATYLGVRRALE